MRIRNVLGLAVAVVTLGTLAAPGASASPGTVSFAGTFQITPGGTQAPQFCFTALATCPNEIVSTGVAAGSSTTVPVIDGLYVKLDANEGCLAGIVLAPTGRLPITIQVHNAQSGQWTTVNGQTTWDRKGMAVAITGDVANGTAHLTPLGVPLCGAPLTFAVEGDVALVA